jgi:hypothetical protein
MAARPWREGERRGQPAAAISRARLMHPSAACHLNFDPACHGRSAPSGVTRLPLLGTVSGIYQLDGEASIRAWAQYAYYR